MNTVCTNNAALYLFELFYLYLEETQAICRVNTKGAIYGISPGMGA